MNVIALAAYLQRIVDKAQPMRNVFSCVWFGARALEFQSKELTRTLGSSCNEGEVVLIDLVLKLSYGTSPAFFPNRGNNELA